MCRSVRAPAPSGNPCSDLARPAAEALLQLLGMFTAFHLMETRQKRLQVSTGQLTVLPPLHGTGFRTAGAGGHSKRGKGAPPYKSEQPSNCMSCTETAEEFL